MKLCISLIATALKKRGRSLTICLCCRKLIPKTIVELKFILRGCSKFSLRRLKYLQGKKEFKLQDKSVEYLGAVKDILLFLVA
ncbi:hypothetical protein ALT785_150077 [Alteromonas infernus]